MASATGDQARAVMTEKRVKMHYENRLHGPGDDAYLGLDDRGSEHLGGREGEDAHDLPAAAEDRQQSDEGSGAEQVWESRGELDQRLQAGPSYRHLHPLRQLSDVVCARLLSLGIAQ